jgi:hypothetical protein
MKGNMAIKHYTNWRGWWLGMRPKLLKAVGEGGMTALSSFGVCNMATALPADFLKKAGMSWETMVIVLLGTIAVRLLAAGFSYIAANPEPEEVEEPVTTAAGEKAP